MTLLTWDEYNERLGKRGWPPQPGRGVRTPADFWPRVVTDDPSGCWPWTGPYNTEGYGNVHRTGIGNIAAHRLAWTYVNGPIPDGMWVLHRCDNRRCVNLAHLYLGTPADNGRDRAARYAVARSAGIRIDRIDPWVPSARWEEAS